MIAEFVVMQCLTLSCKTQVLLWHLLNEDSVLLKSVLLLVAAFSACTSRSSEARTTLVGFLLRGVSILNLFFSKAASVCAQYL